MNITARLTGKQFNGYLRLRLPHELYDVVNQVVAAYRSATLAERQAIVSDMQPRAAGVLSAYGERMAAIAARSQSVEPLQRGLVAMGMAEGRLEDNRTNLYVLAAVNHSAVTIGSDLPTVIDGMARRLAPARPQPTCRASASTESPVMRRMMPKPAPPPPHNAAGRSLPPVAIGRRSCDHSTKLNSLPYGFNGSGSPTNWWTPTEKNTSSGA